MALAKRPGGTRAELTAADGMPMASGSAFTPWIPEQGGRAPTRGTVGGDVRRQALVLAASVHLTSMWHIIDPDRKHFTATQRRVLTKPSERVANDGCDNKHGDLVVAVSDAIVSPSGVSFEVLSALGRGTFGQVFRVRLPPDRAYALKVIRNGTAFQKQAQMEIAILKMLQLPRERDKGVPADVEKLEAGGAPQAEGRQADSKEKGTGSEGTMNRRGLFVQLRDHFIFKGHLCLVFEHLGVNLLQLLQQTNCRGLSLSLIRYFTKQLLQALALLKELGIMHCDIKPENILLQNLQSPAIKLIDFGSACLLSQEPSSTYIQSRFYRSPEVLLGHTCDCAIDVWSLGTIAAELFLGLPLLAGETEYNQLARIVEMLGPPPRDMLAASQLTAKYFDCEAADHAESPRYRLKQEAIYAEENGCEVSRNKQYFKYRTLPQLIESHPKHKAAPTPDAETAERERRRALLDFCQGLLRLSPLRRWTAAQALDHPFITGERFTGGFEPSVLDSPQPSQPNVSPQPTGAAMRVVVTDVAVAPSPSSEPPTRLPGAAPVTDATSSQGSSDEPVAESEACAAPRPCAEPPDSADSHVARDRVASTTPSAAPPTTPAAAPTSTHSASNKQRSPHSSSRSSRGPPPAPPSLQRSPPQAIWSASRLPPVQMPPALLAPQLRMQMASSPTHMTPSPPPYYGSPPLSVSPPSMAALHMAMTGGAASAPPYAQPDGLVFAQMHGSMGSSPPTGFYSAPHHMGCECSCATSPYGVQLAASPPDRSMLSAPRVQECVGACAQCRNYGGGVFDKRDGNLYCHSCWQHYEASAYDAQSPPTSPTPAGPYCAPSYLINPYYYPSAPPAPAMRISVNTGAGRGGEQPPPAPPKEARQGERRGSAGGHRTSSSKHSANGRPHQRGARSGVRAAEGLAANAPPSPPAHGKPAARLSGSALDRKAGIPDGTSELAPAAVRLGDGARDDSVAVSADVADLPEQPEEKLGRLSIDSSVSEQGSLVFELES